MRFEAWRCNCDCPLFQVMRPECHKDGCAAFVPENIHEDEGGSD